MCGIYGVFDVRSVGLPPADALARMASITVHRGPDDEGAYVHPRLLLGMRRLSILDVGGGHQPIANEDGTIQVVCNGEIYNYRELTAKLLAAGHQFKTRSDTEVLVHAYEQYGDRFVEHVRGMFAFALWDSRRERLLIARDRLGIKPLYYCETDGRLAFASETKALLAASGMPGEIDRHALQEYVSLGYVPAPHSMFRGIRKLAPATVLTAEHGRVATHQYWTPTPRVVRPERDERDWAEQLLETMRAAVVSQMVSDVPLGAFLSGGIDSSTIVALMAQASSQPVKTYSIGFETSGTAGAYYNELTWARKVAERYATDHHEIVVKPDVATLLPRLLWHMDEPVADAAFITTFLVAEFARRDVTVILSGVGGDELFGGYRRYLAPAYDRAYGRLPAWLRAWGLPALVRRLPSDRHSHFLNLSRQLRAYVTTQTQPFPERYRSYVEVYAPAAVAGLLRQPLPPPPNALGAAFDAVPNGDPLDRMMCVDLLTQLPDDLLLLTDKMTMATSLECRVPFLDETVVDLALEMPAAMKIRGRRLKHVLKEALPGLLPTDVLNRGKRGFGAPLGAWLTGELAPLMRHVLSRNSVEKRGLLRWEPVAETIAAHEQRREDRTDHLLTLIMLEIWSRLYLDGRSVEDVATELAEV